MPITELVRRALLMIAALSALALPASAEAVTFGSNLGAHVSNSNVTCGDFNIFQYAGRVGCSAYTTGNASNPADTSATHVIPFPDPRVYGDQHGTITQVAFKPSPGAAAGPARLSVIEYIRDANSTADPGLAQDIADSANFTMAPGADGLVHVATNLPARSLYNPNDNSYRFDVLVVSMLDNTTPIPADLSSSFLSAWISPYVDIPSTQGDLTVPLPADRQGTGCCGFGPDPFYVAGAWYTLGEVLMQAELTIQQPSQPSQPSQPTKPVKIGKPRLRRNTVILPVACALDRTCKGLLELLSRGKGGAKARTSSKSKRTVVYGRARFSVAAHAKQRLKVKLKKAGKRLLKRAQRKGESVRMVARARVGAQVTATTVKLRPARAGPTRRCSRRCRSSARLSRR
jgi:hypothetical protein